MIKVQEQSLCKDLNELAGLLRKYGHEGQATVVDDILNTLNSPHPDYKRLTGVDMWGGSGAVWEVSLTSSGTSSEARTDERAFLRAIIRIAVAMDTLKIGTERSRSTAKIFQEWLDKGLF
jgi:hypothetical protein